MPTFYPPQTARLVESLSRGEAKTAMLEATKLRSKGEEELQKAKCLPDDNPEKKKALRMAEMRAAKALILHRLKHNLTLSDPHCQATLAFQDVMAKVSVSDQEALVLECQLELNDFNKKGGNAAIRPLQETPEQRKAKPAVLQALKLKRKATTDHDKIAKMKDDHPGKSKAMMSAEIRAAKATQAYEEAMSDVPEEGRGPLRTACEAQLDAEVSVA